MATTQTLDKANKKENLLGKPCIWHTIRTHFNIFGAPVYCEPHKVKRNELKKKKEMSWEKLHGLEDGDASEVGVEESKSLKLFPREALHDEGVSRTQGQPAPCEHRVKILAGPGVFL